VPICAGTAGVGCVVIGVATVGGILYYVWSNGKAKQGISDNGSILRSEYLEDPENISEVDNEWEDYVTAKNQESAEIECRKQLTKYRGAELLDTVPHPSAKGTYECKFKGGTSK
jgi:hypothetical protein